jgi:hypothetical protein
MSYSYLTEETKPLLRNRFKSMKPDKTEIKILVNNHNKHQDINNFVASYLLDNIKINNNNVTFNNSEEQLKEDIIRICKKSTDNFNTKQIKDYIINVCDTYEQSENFVFHIHRLKSYGLHSLYLVNNIFCYIAYMFSGAQYNYHNVNDVCFEFNKLNITQKQIDNIKNKNVSEIANLIIILLQCDNCEFGVNESIIDIEEIIIN